MSDRVNRETQEQGQVLVLAVVMIAAMMTFMMMVIDVGMLIMERRNTQNVVDAVALAGAQELPDSTVNATAVAREYATLNGVDPDSIVITFSCTSTNLKLCNPGLGTYDTINITTTQKAPSFFGGILGIVGSGTNCWTDGCDVTLGASACRGACGAGAAKVDVVVTIDHTGSMSAADLVNAKDGAKAFMSSFDAQNQRLGLGVTPPVDPTNLCDTINTWADPKVWLPVPLTFDYQTAPQVLNPSSALVATTSCLDLPSGELPGPHTNLGDPLKAALAELVANGRSDADWAIVLETDGAANIMDATAAASIGATGPCDYAVKIANQIKAMGIPLYTVAFGADDRCTRDAVGTFWYNKPANQLLAAMATDAAHSFIEPRGADLDPIFLAIGQELAGGSKLVK